MNEASVGKTKGAGWQIGVSRTVPVDLDDVWSYLISTDGLAVWLGQDLNTPFKVGDEYRTADGTRGQIRSLRPHDRIRLTWQPPDRQDDATVQIAVTPAATGCTIRFHTERLYDSSEREHMRAHWRAIADAIEHDLTAR
jgi:uncharacterized protein YndB with AHSA1/START domain